MSWIIVHHHYHLFWIAIVLDTVVELHDGDVDYVRVKTQLSSGLPGCPHLYYYEH